MAHLPIAQIITAEYNDAHFNHIHVSGKPMHYGEPPLNYPGWTAAILEVYDALEFHFGPGAYFMDVDHHWEDNRFVIDDPDVKWTHMGVYNRRKIAGSTSWSQHAYANGLDIGPYYGIEQQAPFVEFLERADHVILRDMFTEHEIKELKGLVAALDSVGSNGGFAAEAVKLIRKERQLPLHKPEVAVPGVAPHSHRFSGVVEGVTGDSI